MRKTCTLQESRQNFKDSRVVKPNNWKEIASAMKEKFEKADTNSDWAAWTGIYAHTVIF